MNEGLLPCPNHMHRDAAKGNNRYLLDVFVLISQDSDTQNLYFRNGLYFCNVTAGATTYKLWQR